MVFDTTASNTGYPQLLHVCVCVCVCTRNTWTNIFVVKLSPSCWWNCANSDF